MLCPSRFYYLFFWSIWSGFGFFACFGRSDLRMQKRERRHVNIRVTETPSEWRVSAYTAPSGTPCLQTGPTHRRLRYHKYNGHLSNPDTVWPDRHTKSSLAEGRSEHASAIESAIVLWRWRRPSRALSQLWTHRPPLWAHIMQQTKACHSLACPKDWFSREFSRFKMRCNKHHNDGVKMHLWHNKSRLFSYRQMHTCYAYKSYSVNPACLSFSIKLKLIIVA